MKEVSDIYGLLRCILGINILFYGCNYGGKELENTLMVKSICNLKYMVTKITEREVKKINKDEGMEKVDKIVDIKDDEIMTVGEVAAYFKVSEDTAFKLVENGEIPAFKIGGHWRINKNELAKFMDKLKDGRGGNIGDD